MRLIELWHRLSASIRRRRLERDLDDEIAFHLSMRQDALAAAGSDAADARRRFGNATAFKEEMRDMWTFPSLESVRQDIQYAVRSMRRSPGFASVAILAMAIGIGGNTAIFSLMDAMRAQALPFGDPGELVVLNGNVMRARLERRGASYPDYQDWRTQAKSFVDLAAFDPQMQTLGAQLQPLGRIDEPERIDTEFVSAPYFKLLGISAALGRTFDSKEDDFGQPAHVVVLSERLWKRRFGGDPQVVGRTIRLNDAPFTIVGVMPPDFKGLTDAADAWIPFAQYAPPRTMTDRGSRGFEVLGRLKRGVTIAAAQSELNAISRLLEQTYPNTNEKRGVEVGPLDVELFGPLRPAVLTLMAAVAFVLLIACANVANLVIARSEARRRELAVRTALGAGRARLARQLITESSVLTMIGALAGLVLARASVTALVVWSPITFPSFLAPGLDLRVALFTVGVSVVCGILVGLAPGLQGGSADLSDSLKEASKGSDGKRSHRVRTSLVVAEVALAVVLLVGASLMIRSVRNLASLHPGFSADSVLTLHATIPRTRMAPSAASDPTVPPGPPPLVSASALLERIRAVPGVQSAALGNDLPLDGGAGANFFTAEGQSEVNAQNIPRAFVHRVTPGFFDALRISLLSGRTFSEDETSRLSSAVIVSENVAKRFWPGQDPIGRRIKMGRPDATVPWLSIVGVVGEVKYRGLPDNPTADPDLYIPFLDRNQQVAIVVRTAVPPADLTPPIRAAIRAAATSIPIYNVATMDDLMSRRTARSRFMMWLMSVFAAIALLLSVVGIYGVMSYLVAQRTREIGIRIALGAHINEIVRLVVGDGARWIATGIVIGAVTSLALQRLIGRLLFGVASVDASIGLAIAALLPVALVACLVPALRAVRIDPLHALRRE